MANMMNLVLASTLLLLLMPVSIYGNSSDPQQLAKVTSDLDTNFDFSPPGFDSGGQPRTNARTKSASEWPPDEQEMTSQISIEMTSPVTEVREDEAELWSLIVDWVQFGCTTAGFIANILTLVTLYVNGEGFSQMMVLLFRHQAFADAIVCLVASIVILQPFMWLTGNYCVDQFICHVWHGQAIYWGFVTISTYNLVLIAYERYVSVCKPFDYADLEAMSKTKLYCYFFLLYVFTIFITHGTYIQTKLIDNECVNEYAVSGVHMERYFKFFVIFTYVTTYLMPALIMGTLYGLVAHTLRMRGKDTRLAQSRIVDRASADLTKTAVVVTVIFVITIGYDLHYYLLGHTGAVVYHLNTPIQKVGVFLSNINSTCNPLVYALLMPLYRRSVRKTLSCQRDSQLKKTKVMSSTSSSLQTCGTSVSTVA